MLTCQSSAIAFIKPLVLFFPLTAMTASTVLVLLSEAPPIMKSCVIALCKLRIKLNPKCYINESNVLSQEEVPFSKL